MNHKEVMEAELNATPEESSVKLQKDRKSPMESGTMLDLSSGKSEDKGPRVAVPTTNANADFVENVMKPRAASVHICDDEKAGAVK